MRAHASAFRVRSMCRVLKVSRSGFYAWCSRPPSRRTLANAQLLHHIRQIHLASRQTCGAVKTWKILRTAGETCGRHRVARLRQRHGIEANRLRRFRSRYAAANTEPPAPNVLNRDFQASQPDRVWVGDVTFIPTREGMLYLAVLLDLHSRRVVGWAMSEKNNQALVTDALKMAIEYRQPAVGLIHHTDQGATYTSSAYRAILQTHGMIPSMSRKGDCWDNAVAESFFGNLKNELTWHHTFRSRDQARVAIFDYIEVFYNRQRLHQTLGYVSPAQYEQQRVAVS
ncbi:MAG: IS3 family transposase [Gammaproteobacteria bacterium]